MGTDDIGRELEARNSGKNVDTYGILQQETEVDSDVNEDRGRERQLDDSFEAWYRHVGQQVQRQEGITNVPSPNVFDAAAELDEDTEGSKDLP